MISPVCFGADLLRDHADAMKARDIKNLNRLKQTDLLAFACWHQAQEIAKR